MSALLPFIQIDSDTLLAQYFTRYQLAWIHAEDPFHERRQQVFALAEKSVRIGWTFCDGFKNVRKRLRFRKRDYLFVTRDWPSALEYMNHVYDFADMFGYTRAVLSHGEDVLKVKGVGPDGRPTSITEEVKIGYIKFDNGSRIIAFSSNPYAMAVYGGDVGLDEFAKHPNANLLWQTAQARVTWNYDMSVWSSHDGEDTLFNQFVQQARAACVQPSSPPLSETLSPASSSPPGSAGVPAGESSDRGPSLARSSSDYSAITNSAPLPAPIEIQKSKIKNGGNTNSSPWNLYFRVTMPDAIELGLLDVINRTQDSLLTAEQFLADCQSRSGTDEIFQQSYMCNPMGAETSRIVEWSAIEHCRFDYNIIRVHLEHAQIVQQFGAFSPAKESSREYDIEEFIHKTFLELFQKKSTYRLGFDVAASGQGDLAVIYIDERKTDDLWLRGLFSCRTEDWNFLQIVLFKFLSELRSVTAAGDASGLGRQICWEAGNRFRSKFIQVQFASKKHDLGFALMNQLATAQKRFPTSEQDIASDFFALRKHYQGTRWSFSESRNHLNPASHCDIAWAGALATHAHIERKATAGAAVLLDNGMVWCSDGSIRPLPPPKEYPNH